MTRCAATLPAVWFAVVVMVGVGRLAPRARSPVDPQPRRPPPPGRLLAALGRRVRALTGAGSERGDTTRGATLVAVVLLLLVVPPLALVPPLVAGVRSLRRGRRDRAASEASLWRELPEAAELLAIAVGAGSNPLGAVEAVAARLDGPVGAAFAAAVQRVRSGERLDDALGETAGRLGDPAMPLLDALRAGERYGTPLLPGLRRCGLELRAARRRRAEEAARRVPVRLLLPLCGCVLPAFVLLTFVPLLAGGLGSLDLGG